MLALVSIFLATFVVAALGIWIYRTIFGVQNYEAKNAARKHSGSTMRPGAQQGYVSMGRKSEKAPHKTRHTIKAKPALTVVNGSNKVPWGW